MGQANIKKEVNVTALVRIAFLIALSMVGAYIKFPSLIGTPALDSFPAYLAAFVWGGIPGAVVAFLGHIFTSMLVGFPLSIPIHIIVGLGMSGCVLLTAWVYDWQGKILASISAVVANGVLLPMIFIVIPGFGVAFFVGMLPSLLVATIINVGIAFTLSPVAAKFNY